VNILRLDVKAQSSKNGYELNLIKNENFCSMKDPDKKVKRKATREFS
jgi:hypothetical protein